MKKLLFSARMTGLMLLILAFSGCKPEDDPLSGNGKLSYTVDGKSYKGRDIMATLATSALGDDQLLGILDSNKHHQIFLLIPTNKTDNPFQPGWTFKMGPGLSTVLNIVLIVANDEDVLNDIAFSDPEGSLTITEFDPINQVFSLIFDVNLYNKRLEASIRLKGTIKDLDYTLE